MRVDSRILHLHNFYFLLSSSHSSFFPFSLIHSLTHPHEERERDEGESITCLHHQEEKERQDEMKQGSREPEGGREEHLSESSLVNCRERERRREIEREKKREEKINCRIQVSIFFLSLFIT